MKNRYNWIEHKMKREFHNFQRGNTAEQREALVKALLAKEAKDRANKAADILKEAFWKEYNITKEEGIRKYHIARKESLIELKWPILPVEWKTVLDEGQMIMEVNSKWKLKIRLNTDGGMIYYHAENFSNEDLAAEIPAIKLFIDNNTELPSTSKFIKEDPFAGYEINDIEAKISQNTNIEKFAESSQNKYYRMPIPILSGAQKVFCKFGPLEQCRTAVVTSRINNNKFESTAMMEKHIEGEEKNAYVQEFITGPEELRGIQFFNEAAAKNLWIYTQLLKDEDIPTQRTKESVLKFIQDNGLKKLGKYDPKHQEVVFVGDKYMFMLQDGKIAEIDLRRWYFVDVISGMNPSHGYPIILANR